MKKIPLTCFWHLKLPFYVVIQSFQLKIKSNFFLKCFPVFSGNLEKKILIKFCSKIFPSYSGQRHGSFCCKHRSTASPGFNIFSSNLVYVLMAYPSFFSTTSGEFKLNIVDPVNLRPPFCACLQKNKVASSETFFLSLGSFF